MTPDVHDELEELVGAIGTLVDRLRGHDQPLATQLLEMAVLEIRSRMYGIADDEVQALVDRLSSQKSAILIDPTQSKEPAETPAKMSSSRVVVLGNISRSNRKRRN